MNALKEHFLAARNFLRSDFRKCVFLCAAGFLASGLAGYFIGIHSPETIDSIISFFMETAEQKGVIEEDGSLSTIALLANNWTAMMITVAYGLIPFAFLPVSSLITNGFILGITGAMSQLYDQTLSFWLAAILPHGVFELSALVLSIACGVYVCLHISRRILRYPNRINMIELLCNVLRIVLLLVAPLTVAAALIEAYITPIVMSLFL